VLFGVLTLVGTSHCDRFVVDRKPSGVVTKDHAPKKSTKIFEKSGPVESISAVPQLSVSQQLPSKPQSHDAISIRNELFEFHLVNKANNIQHHEILKDIAARKIPHLPLHSIPLIDFSLSNGRNFFIRAIASVVGFVNDRIMKHRELVLLVQEKQKKNIPLTEDERQLFNKICTFYRTKNFEELVMRVAPVPVSLAVAQAALESNFGSNNHIYKSNAYFGLMVSSTRLLKFDNLFSSAVGYSKTLNVNPCYREFRKHRARMLLRSEKIDGLALLQFMHSYGTDKNYRTSTEKIIRFHKLSCFDE